MSNSILEYQNHDIIKIIINNPMLFNFELIIIFSILFLIPSKKVNSNDKYLDKSQTNEIKGLAILLIIIHHLCRHTINNTSDLVLFYDVGYIGVALFLFLSGYGLTCSWKSNGLKKYFSKKLLKIYVPFVFMNILLIVANYYLLDIKLSSSETIKSILGIVIFDRNYWYMKFLFFCYITFYFIMNLKIDNKYKAFILLLTSIFVINSHNAWIGLGGANAFSFPLGVILALYNDRITNVYSKVRFKPSVYMLILISGIMMIVFYKAGKSDSAFNLTFLSMFTAFSIVFLLLIIDNIKAYKTSRFFEFLGKISFELYLIHGALMYSYDFILYKGPIEITFLIYFIVIVGLSVILNMLFSIFYKGCTKVKQDIKI